MRKPFPLSLLPIALLLIIAVLIVNPFRTGLRDDDWANARTTERLYSTGEYRLDNWLAPNSAPQAAWGSVFMRVFGAQHASLYFSQIVLLAVCAFGMFALARQFGLGETTALLIVLTLLSNDVVVTGGFSYMSDVPALAAQIMALWAWTRGIQRGQTRWMIVGGIFAAVAILGRQQNIALLAGLVWALLHDRRRWRLYGIGVLLTLPALGLSIGLLRAPSWAQRYVIVVQRDYFAEFLQQPSLLIIRPVRQLLAFVAYLGLMGLPFGWIGALSLRRGQWLRMTIIFMGVTLLLIVITRTVPAFPLSFGQFDSFFIAVLILATLLSVPLLLIFWTHLQMSRPPEAHLLEGNVAAAIGLLLLTSLFYSSYLMPTLPGVLIILGVAWERTLLKYPSWRRWAVSIAFIATSILFIYHAIDTRSRLDAMEMNWGSVCYWVYNGYTGGFDQFAQTHDPSVGFAPYFEALPGCAD